MRRNILKFLAFALIAVSVSGCSLVNVVDASKVATVNGEDIRTSEYMYYLALSKMNIQQTAASAAQSDDFWNTTEIEGKKAGDVAKERALDDAVRATIIAQKAKEAGFSADTPEAKNQISKAKASIGSAYEKYGFTEDGLTLAYEKAYLRTKLFDKYAEDGTISVGDAEMKEYYEKNYRTVKHILFQTTDPQTGNTVRSDDEALALANDALAKLSEGADFDALMAELSDDPGSKSSPEGYTFTKDGSMVAEFEDSAFKLLENEISQPVKTSFGYHILKRVALIPYDTYVSQNTNEKIKSAMITDAEDKFVDEWKSSAEIKNDSKKYDSIKVEN